MQTANSVGIVRSILLGLIAIGLYGALSVSYATIMRTSPCPDALGVPICFIVLAGYSVMFLSALCKPKPKIICYFMLAWLLVFFPAMAGTFLELAAGNVCPRSAWGWPLCYVSLGLAMTIISVFVLIVRLD